MEKAGSSRAGRGATQLARDHLNTRPFFISGEKRHRSVTDGRTLGFHNVCAVDTKSAAFPLAAFVASAPGGNLPLGGARNPPSLAGVALAPVGLAPHCSLLYASECNGGFFQRGVGWLCLLGILAWRDKTPGDGAHGGERGGRDAAVKLFVGERLVCRPGKVRRAVERRLPSAVGVTGLGWAPS